MAKIKLTKLDTLFSEFIRKRAIKAVGGCERCLTPKYDKQKDNGDIFPAWKQLQCSHFWGRGKQSVRYDEDNAVGLCGACHMYFTAHPAEHAKFFQAKLGLDKYDYLEYRAYHSEWNDGKLIEIYLKEKIREVNNE